MKSQAISDASFEGAEIRKEHFSPGEAAGVWGFSESAVLKWIREARVPVARFGRNLRISRKTLDEISERGLPPLPQKGNE